MTLNDRIDAFAALGKFLQQFSTFPYKKIENLQENNTYYNLFEDAIETAYHHNSWFTKDNIVHACKSWSEALTEDNLTSWTSNYNFVAVNPQKVAIIMAGNIPLVGFHDFLSVLMSGHNVQVKQSSNDKILLPVLANYLMAIAPEFKDKISFVKELLTNFDAVIATGSNNTARYFDYYFGKKPNIIRQNRNSVAILTGKETKEELHALGEDIFRYYGLGCRSVSKLYVPQDYVFDTFFEGIYDYASIIHQDKYANNYDYNKAVYLMSQFKLLENGFLMLKEDESFGSPIATIFYEFYNDLEELKENIEKNSDKIQCVVNNVISPQYIKFGQTQSPTLTDYADGVDTVDFLLKI